jgi:CBS domain-containing protein
MGKLVRDAMTPRPRTVSSESTIVDAARILEEQNIGRYR